jgi:AcrR family transcriptional regulator
VSAGQTLTRREKQQRTREALLEAAAGLFAERGLDKVSIDEVTQAAGYTKGAFYANFRSKEELFLVMLDEQFAKELARLDHALAGNDDLREEARAAAADFIRYASMEEWPALYFQFVAYAAQNEEFRQELATRHRAMRERLAQLFKRWKGGLGASSPVPFDQVAAMMFFMADGFLVDRIVEPGLSDELYTTMIGVFARGLQGLAEDAQLPAEAGAPR